MCKALAEIMKPEIDEAFQNGFDDGFGSGFGSGFDSGFGSGFDNGFDNGIISVFKNMIQEGLPKELAQKYTKLSNELVEKALAEMNMQ